MKKAKELLIISCITLVCVFTAGEIFLRIKGHLPYEQLSAKSRVEPGGSLFQKDSLLGYSTRPGKFKVILNEQITFTTTQDSNGFRICSDTGMPDSLPEIWIAGGSFTFGWGVDTDESWPFLLQTELQNYKLLNLGTGGYGTLQSFLQIKRLLARRKSPEYLILAYASFHDQRNVADAFWQQAVTSVEVLDGLQIPSARLNDDTLQMDYIQPQYAPWPLSGTSALIYWLERRVMAGNSAELKKEKVTEMLIEKLAALCEKHDIQLILAGIEPDVHTQKVLQKYGDLILTADISVNRQNEGMSLLPVDPHPSYRAHEIYAEKMNGYLRSLGL